MHPSFCPRCSQDLVLLALSIGNSVPVIMGKFQKQAQSDLVSAGFTWQVCLVFTSPYSDKVWYDQALVLLSYNLAKNTAMKPRYGWYLLGFFPATKSLMRTRRIFQNVHILRLGHGNG